MGRHSARSFRTPRSLMALVIAPIAAGAVYVAVVAWPLGSAATSTPVAVPCQTTLRVVTAKSFAPVLAALAPGLDQADECVRLDVTVADGREAAARVALIGAHVWIPDDAAWASIASGLKLAPPEVHETIATSPIYLVADPATAERVEAGGSSWLGLANLASGPDGLRLVVRDPGGSGDGMLAAGAVGEAVWIKSGMDASAHALTAALPNTRTVQDVAVPEAAGEVALVPEYAVPGVLSEHGEHLVAIAPVDHTALMRYTWLPTAEAATDPAVAPAIRRTLEALRSEQGDVQLEAAGLRRPDGEAPALAAAAGLPAMSAAPFEVLGRHHVEHVFATWYVSDRRSDLLVVIDVSGSMANVVNGSNRPLIDLVREGTNELAGLLPDDSQMSIWEFGSRLDPPRDHRELLPKALLTPAHREALAGVTATMTAKRTGTGLYDTLLAAYIAGRDSYRQGVPNHVLLFTDGRNEDDPGSVSADGLTQALIAAQDPARPVKLTVVTFGPDPQADLLASILKPIGGYVDPLTNAAEVNAVFIHVAAGGLHH